MPKQQGVGAKCGVSTRLVSTRVSTLPDGTYTDPGQTGLQLRIRSKQEGKATRAWLLRFKFKGEETRIVLGHFPETTLDAARGLARTAREQASQGIDPRRAGPRRKAMRSPLPLSAAPVGGKHTVEFLAHEYVERHVKPNHKQPDYVVRILAKDVLTEWKGRDARSIKPREVIELLDGIVARGSPVMANHTGDIIKQMFLYGVHRSIVDSSPVQLLYRPGGKESPRDRCLTDDELKVLLADPKAATRFERLGHAIVIFLLTAVRRSELALARFCRDRLCKNNLAHTGRKQQDRQGPHGSALRLGRARIRGVAAARETLPLGPRERGERWPNQSEALDPWRCALSGAYAKTRYRRIHIA